MVMMFPIAANLIFGCCDCLETIFFDYTNCMISLENLDNSGQVPVVSSSNSILKNAFGLRVEVERKEELCDNYSKPLFFSSAYATSCDCPPETIYKPLDSIVSVNIITLMDFDSTHFSNDNITGYFSVLRSTEFMSIDEFFSNEHNEIYDLDDSNLTFDLMLMIPPAENAEYQFEVLIELSDGRVLSKISNLVELL